MRKKLTILGLCGVVCLLLGAVAVETVEWIKESRIVSTTTDIFYRYLDARDDFPPLPLPMGAEDVLSRMEADDWSFLNDHWFFNQHGFTLYVPKDSKLAKQLKLPLQILAIEDVRRGEITIYCEDKKGEWKGLALFDAPPILDETAPFYATLTAEEKQQDLFWNLNATRVRWTATLKPESEMLTDFVFQRDAAVESMSLLEEGGMMAMMSVPPEHTNDIYILKGEQESNGVVVPVYCPSGVTNIEIYSTTSLFSNWVVATENLMLADGTNVVRWLCTSEEKTVFFRAGDGAADFDGDTLPDARETIVHKTDSAKWDTDGDWLSDGWEITNSLDALTSDNELDDDSDGLTNGEEYQWGTDPFDTDSDGDGMPDLWEAGYGTDPQVDDAEEDPDEDGLSNFEEFTAGTNPQVADTDGDGISDGYEVTGGMLALDPSDVFDDLDGDLVPNFYEYIHLETDPSDSSSVPVPTAVVSTNGHDGTFTNLQEAVDAVATNSYPIILIEPGVYSVSEAVEVALPDVLIYAVSGTVVLDGGGSNRLLNAVSGNPVFAGLVIQNGQSTDDGGAIFISEAKPRIRNCTFLNNQSDDAGGAIYVESGTLEVRNCVFKGNTALDGGGVYCDSDFPTFINCTWVDNHALAQGGAIYNGSVINGIVWSNRADISDTQIYGATVSYSCVEGGYEGVSNTTNDPHLVHRWHLSSQESSCVNAGNAADAARFDLDGELRDLLPDIGCDEWVDNDVDDLPDWWEIEWFGNLDSITNGNLPPNDSDGRFSYVQKYIYELNPGAADFDGDGLSDYAEIYIYETDPLVTNALDLSVGYLIEEAAYEWVDISQTGRAVTNFSDLDDGYAEIQIGFEFPFFGGVYTSAYVCNNGFVSFGESSTEFDNQSLPSDQLPQKALCVFWDDLRMEHYSNSTVYIQLDSNQCIISYEDIPFYDDENSRLGFQVILRENGQITYQYKDVSSDGTLATVGAQWFDDDGVEFYAANLTNGTALSVSMDGAKADFDSDGVRDAWEMEWFGNLISVTNGSDFVAGTNLFTYAEAAYLGLNPNSTDTDDDGLTDTYEVENGLNPVVPQDLDGDGMPDHFETAQGLNLADANDALNDPDDDGFPNIYEYRHGTDLFNAVSIPSPDRYVSLTGQHIEPFTNSTTAATNIQSVLVAAEAYDIILIADGTYTGDQNRNLMISGKPLMLFSENGTSNCIINCEGGGRGFSVAGSSTFGSVLAGIQFFQGYSDDGYSSGDGLGGAVYGENT